MPKKYQSVDTDPDSEDEQPQQPLTKPTDKLLEKADQNKADQNEADQNEADQNEADKIQLKIPRKYKNKYNIEPEKVVNAIKEGKVQLTNKQVRKLIAPDAKEKRVVSDERKAQLLEQLKRGRETIAKNKLLHGDTARQDLLKRKEALIAEKAISVEKPPKGKPRNMKPVSAPAPEPEPEPAPAPAPIKKFGRRHMIPSSDTEDGDTTDTAQIKRVRRKIKMVRDVAEPVAQPSYANLSLAEKLLAKLNF
jgi:hypothetical protein